MAKTLPCKVVGMSIPGKGIPCAKCLRPERRLAQLEHVQAKVKFMQIFFRMFSKVQIPSECVLVILVSFGCCTKLPQTR